jgi:excisionase family DNA binding protein
MKMPQAETTPDAATGNTKLAAFIDEPELRRRLPVSRRTIHNWRRAGKIPSIVIGRRVLFCWENVEEALRRLERGGVQ